MESCKKAVTNTDYKYSRHRKYEKKNVTILFRLKTSFAKWGVIYRIQNVDCLTLYEVIL